MNRDNVTRLAEKEEICDPLHDIIRAGAQELLAQAINAEVDEFLATHAGLAMHLGR